MQSSTDATDSSLVERVQITFHIGTVLVIFASFILHSSQVIAIFQMSTYFRASIDLWSLGLYEIFAIAN